VRILMLMLLLGLCALASGCDYPEAGFYELAALDGDGKTIKSFPFMIEELTDDTDLTIGFNIMLPQSGKLAVVPLKNVRDYSRRAWMIEMSGQESGAGGLAVELSHADDKLSFAGNYTLEETLAGRRERSWPISGELRNDPGGETAKILLADTPPANVLALGGTPRGYIVRVITQAKFEKALGGSIKTAKRLDPHGALVQPISHDEGIAGP
jgi:hypothetical protein